MTAPRPKLVPRPEVTREDVQRIIRLHWLAIWRQLNTEEGLVYLGIAVLVASTLLGLAIGITFWGWPR